MSACVKIILVIILRFILKVFWLFPIQKQQVVFNSYGGKSISCNPKYIYLYLQQNYGNQYEYLWCINDKQEQKKYQNEYPFIKIIPARGITFFYYSLTSKFYVGNGIAPSYLPFRKSQYVIGTWHGGGAYKKGGIDITDSILMRFAYKLSAKNVTYVISSCKTFSKVANTAFLVNKEKILEIGLPRNDLFFKDSWKHKNVIREKIQVPSSSKVALFAPTFRSKIDALESEFNEANIEFDIDKLSQILNEKFGGTWIIMHRSHYHCKHTKTNSKMVDVSDYPDMQELLLIADVLITDYSSSIWDFSLTQRPCFIIAPDIFEYEKMRGFYTPISHWPFPIAQNSVELYNNIKEFNDDVYKERIKQHHLELGSYEHGTSCQKIYEMVFKDKKR